MTGAPKKVAIPHTVVRRPKRSKDDSAMLTLADPQHSHSPPMMPLTRDRKGTAAEVHINLRASRDDRDLIDRAAAVLHTTRTDFMLGSARGAAVDALLDQSFFTPDGAMGCVYRGVGCCASG